ncbi:hypothetical protein CR513_62760, partial [Mucuna pruriens]
MSYGVQNIIHILLSIQVGLKFLEEAFSIELIVPPPQNRGVLYSLRPNQGVSTCRASQEFHAKNFGMRGVTRRKLRKIMSKKTEKRRESIPKGKTMIVQDLEETSNFARKRHLRVVHVVDSTPSRTLQKMPAINFTDHKFAG